MAIYIEAGWDLDETGNAAVTVSYPSSTSTAYMTTGLFCHTGLTSVLGTSQFSSFATGLQTQLQTLASGYTASYTNGVYTIAHSSQTFSLTFPGTSGATMGTILGMSARATATSHASSIAPYYYLSGAMGAASDWSDYYEPKDVAHGAETDDGNQYAVARTTAPKYLDFTVPYESQAASMKRAAAAATPWTFEHFWEHVRAHKPFVVRDADESIVAYLRPEGASFAPTHPVVGYKNFLHHRFKTLVRGKL